MHPRFDPHALVPRSVSDFNCTTAFRGSRQSAMQCPFAPPDFNRRVRVERVVFRVIKEGFALDARPSGFRQSDTSRVRLGKLLSSSKRRLTFEWCVPRWDALAFRNACSPLLLGQRRLRHVLSVAYRPSRFKLTGVHDVFTTCSVRLQ